MDKYAFSVAALAAGAVQIALLLALYLLGRLLFAAGKPAEKTGESSNLFLNALSFSFPFSIAAGVWAAGWWLERYLPLHQTAQAGALFAGPFTPVLAASLAVSSMAAAASFLSRKALQKALIFSGALLIAGGLVFFLHQGLLLPTGAYWSNGFFPLLAVIAFVSAVTGGSALETKASTPGPLVVMLALWLVSTFFCCFSGADHRVATYAVAAAAALAGFGVLAAFLPVRLGAGGGAFAGAFAASAAILRGLPPPLLPVLLPLAAEAIYSLVTFFAASASLSQPALRAQSGKTPRQGKAKDKEENTFASFYSWLQHKGVPAPLLYLLYLLPAAAGLAWQIATAVAK